MPAATRKIVVQAPTFSLTVTNPAKVAQIVRWFDALPVDPPGIAVACALVLRPNIDLSFRSSRGSHLARAGVPEPSAGICDPIGFKVGGKVKRPLLDRNFGESFARRLERLLGIHLRSHPRLTPKG